MKQLMVHLLDFLSEVERAQTIEYVYTTFRDAVMVRSLGLPLFPMVGERWRVVRMTISLVFLFGINKANTEPVLVEEAGHPFWLLLLWFLRFCWEMKWSKLWLTCV